MIRLFKHYIPHAVLLFGLCDLALLLLAGDLAWHMRAIQIGIDAGLWFEKEHNKNTRQKTIKEQN